MFKFCHFDFTFPINKVYCSSLDTLNFNSYAKVISIRSVELVYYIN